MGNNFKNCSECNITQNAKLHRLQNDSVCKITQNAKLMKN